MGTVLRCDPARLVYLVGQEAAAERRVVGCFCERNTTTLHEVKTTSYKLFVEAEKGVIANVCIATCGVEKRVGKPYTLADCHSPRITVS